MTIDPADHPTGQCFTGRWRVNYQDYQRAIALMAHYRNQAPDAIEAVLVDSAEAQRSLQLMVALLDLSDALMPTLGEPENVKQLQQLAALWAGKHEGLN